MSMPEPGALSNLAREYQSQNPTQRDLEVIAWTEVNKHALGIVKDAIDRALSDVDRESLFKYDTTSNKPLLDHPMNMLRMAAGLISEKDNSWQGVLSSLSNYLPDDVKERLAYEMELPFNQREPLYQELNNLLSFTAKALVWIEVVTSPLVDEIALARSYLNVAMPSVALGEIVTQGELLFETAEAYLHAVGHNHPRFDSLMNYLTQVGEALHELQDLTNVLEQGSLSFDKKFHLANLANQLDNLNDLFNRTDIGSDLRILGPTISAMATVTAALSLPTASPSLAIGMHLASIGQNSNDSELGFLGSAFNNTTQALTSGILTSMVFGARAEVAQMQELRSELTDLRDNGMVEVNGDDKAILGNRPELMLLLDQHGIHPPMAGTSDFNGMAKRLAAEGASPYDNPVYQNLAMRLPGGWEQLSEHELDGVIAQLDYAIEQKHNEVISFIDPGAALFFPNAVNVGLLSIAAAAVAITDYGFGLVPHHNHEDRLLSTELALNLAYSSDVVRTTFEVLARASGAREDVGDLVAEILAMIAMLLAILAAAKGDQDAVQRLLGSMEDKLEEGLDNIEKYLDDKINDGTINSETAIAAHMHLLQARSSLEDHDLSGVIGAYTDALELVGVTENLLRADLDAISELAHNFANAFTGGMDDLSSASTGFFQG